jgi:hypothetical protein
MAPSVSINIGNETILAIQHGDGEKVNLLIADMEKANDRIVSLIRNYETEKDHKGQVNRFHPINTLTMNEDGHGGLTIFFPVNIFNGCKGIDADFNDKVNITISIDFTNKTALLTGDELMPEREPDDC